MGCFDCWIAVVNVLALTTAMQERSLREGKERLWCCSLSAPCGFQVEGLCPCGVFLGFVIVASSTSCGF